MLNSGRPIRHERMSYVSPCGDFRAGGAGSPGRPFPQSRSAVAGRRLSG